MSYLDNDYPSYIKEMRDMLTRETDKHLQEVFIQYSEVGCIEAQYDVNLYYKNIKSIKNKLEKIKNDLAQFENTNLQQVTVMVGGIYPGDELYLTVYKQDGKLYVLGVSSNFEPFLCQDDYRPWLSATELSLMLQGLGDNVVIPSADELIFWQRLEAVRLKANEHLSNAENGAHDAAMNLYECIKSSYKTFYSGKTAENLALFKGNFSEAINIAKHSVLQNHRGWKQIIANLVYAIPGVNLVVAAVRVINVLAYKGNFWFRPNTDSINKLETLESNVAKLKLP